LAAPKDNSVDISLLAMALYSNSDASVAEFGRSRSPS